MRSVPLIAIKCLNPSLPAPLPPARSWFAFALLLWLGLFIITLYKSFVMPDYGEPRAVPPTCPSLPVRLRLSFPKTSTAI